MSSERRTVPPEVDIDQDEFMRAFTWLQQELPMLSPLQIDYIASGWSDRRLPKDVITRSLIAMIANAAGPNLDQDVDERSIGHELVAALFGTPHSVN